MVCAESGLGEASHPGPQGARESTDDDLPLVRDRNVIPRCVWARDVTGSVAATVDREAATTPSHPTPVGIPMEFSPMCGLEAHPSNRRRTARPVEGRDVVQRTGPTQVDSDSDMSPVDEALLDALEDDLRIPQRQFRRTRRRVCSDSEGHHQRGGLASTLEGSADATTVAASSNAVREAHVEFCESVHRICTDTESSIEEIRMPTRVPGRLVLTSGSLPVTQVRAPDNHDEGSVPVEQENAADSHEERFARVRQTIQHERRQIAAVEQFIRTVVERVGPINPEMDIPRRLRRQQWSALNVPLMWSAAEGNRQCAMLEWLVSRAEQLPPMNFCGEQVPGREVATMGWEVLHNAMRSWGIESREGLSEWIHQQGFPRPRWGGHFSGRVQERILNLVIARDVRGTALESLYVHIVMHRLPDIPHGEQPICHQ